MPEIIATFHFGSDPNISFLWNNKSVLFIFHSFMLVIESYLETMVITTIFFTFCVLNAFRETHEIIMNTEHDSDGTPLAHLMIPQTFSRRTRQAFLEMTSLQVILIGIEMDWDIIGRHRKALIWSFRQKYLSQKYHLF